MELDLDAIAAQVAEALSTNEPESAISFLAELSPGQLTTVKGKVLAKGVDKVLVEQVFGLLGGEVINVSGRAPGITLVGALVLVGIAGIAYATYGGVKKRRRRRAA